MYIFLNVGLHIDLHSLISAGMSFHIFGPFTLIHSVFFSSSTKLDFKIAIFHTDIFHTNYVSRNAFSCSFSRPLCWCKHRSLATSRRPGLYFFQEHFLQLYSTISRGAVLGRRQHNTTKLYNDVLRALWRKHALCHHMSVIASKGLSSMIAFL